MSTVFDEVSLTLNLFLFCFGFFCTLYDEYSSATSRPKTTQCKPSRLSSFNSREGVQEFLPISAFFFVFRPEAACYFLNIAAIMSRGKVDREEKVFFLFFLLFF